MRRVTCTPLALAPFCHAFLTVTIYLSAKTAMAERTPCDVDLVERAVQQPVVGFGVAWARENYPDDWETAILDGVVSSYGARGATVTRPFCVTWADGGTEFVTKCQLDILLVADESPKGTEPECGGTAPQCYFCLCS